MAIIYIYKPCPKFNRITSATGIQGHLQTHETHPYRNHNKIIRMDKNIQSIIPACVPCLNKMKESQITGDRTRCLQHIRHFIELADTCKSKPLKHLPKGNGFSLLKTPETLADLNSLAIQSFDMNLVQLQKQFIRFGFRVKKRRGQDGISMKSIYSLSEPFMTNNEAARFEDSLSEVSLQDEEDIDDFPNDEEIEQVMKLKQERMKGLAKPHAIITRPQSDGMLGMMEKKRNYDEISLDLKLYEQDIFSTPLAATRKNNSGNRQPSEEEIAQSISLAERNSMYKQNYQKCSKLIDNTMMEILTAHRAKKIGDKTEELMGKVIEIYDILSDNIENVSSTMREFGVNRVEKKENLSSPGFKPLNGLNDNMK